MITRRELKDLADKLKREFKLAEAREAEMELERCPNVPDDEPLVPIVMVWDAGPAEGSDF